MRHLLAVLLALALPCPASPSVVAFGDSITVGYGARTHAAMWAEQVGAENEAVAGSTIAEQVEKIRAYQGGASVAYWFSCANDILRGTSAEDYRASVLEGVTLLQARGMSVSLGTCLKMRVYPTPKGSALHDHYNEAIRDVAIQTGARLVDIDAVYDPLLHEASFLPYHPNDAGHAAIAWAFGGYRVWLPVAGTIKPPPIQGGGLHPLW